MDEHPWPKDWPDPNDHKKKKTASSTLEKFNSSTIAIGIAIALLGVILLIKNIVSWLPPSQPPLPPKVQPIVILPPSWPSLPVTASSCTLDLVHDRHNCHHLSAITFEGGPHYGQTVTKLTLDPFTTGYIGARFEITYGNAAEGWTVNIGDSQTNGGYAGDGGTQSNDAELQIVNGQLTVYGNDYTNPAQTLDNHRQLLIQDNFAAAGETVTLEVQNQQLWWLDHTGKVGSLTGSALYALARQPDEEGSTNYDIYVAFNRTIDHNGRSGSGVEQVIITLIPAE